MAGNLETFLRIEAAPVAAFQSDEQFSENRARFEETLASGRIRAVEGIDRYLAGGA